MKTPKSSPKKAAAKKPAPRKPAAKQPAAKKPARAKPSADALRARVERVRAILDAKKGEHVVVMRVTDVSSVYVDFLLLNRPVIHAFADREAYRDTRGFAFDWTDDFLAGPIVDDMAGLERALEEVLAGRDGHAENRSRLQKLFHADPNAPASASLLVKLGLSPK